MPGDADAVIRDEAELRERYRPASPAVLHKARPVVDPKAAEFIAACPFVVLATTSASGTDASPRGGPPGFVKVLDEHRVAFADLSGNNRLDSYANVVADGHVGMLFLVPGTGETLRINGRATISTDEAVRERTAIDGVTPKVAMVVEVDEVFIHCAKALRRSGLWDPSSWGSTASPTGAEIIVDQFQLDMDPKDIESGLEADYAATLWVEGGE